MFELTSPRQTFHNSPQSVTALFAALLEPSVAVLVYLTATQAMLGTIASTDLILCLLVFALGFPGRNRFWDTPANAAIGIAASWALLMAVLAACGYTLRSLPLFVPEVMLAWALATPVLQWMAVLAGRRLLCALAVRPQNRRHAVVVGAGPLGARVAQALQARAAVGQQFLGYFDDRGTRTAADRTASPPSPAMHADTRPASRLDPLARAHRLGALAEVAAFVRERGVHEVYITLPLGEQPRIASLLEQLQGTTASLYFVPEVFGIRIIQGRLEDLNGVPVVGLCETPFTGINRMVKRLCDVVLATLILLLVSPLLLAIAVGVKLSSPGPALFRQRRNGLDGEEIVVYKFRSMRTQDDGAHVVQATRQDPRVTPFGALLRRTSLDELPQFINVLQGRMSIVGPRPHAVAHNEMFRDLIKAYMVRHKVKPGITGWAQINGCRGETDTVEKMRARVELDLEYLRHWSLGLDLMIIARTVRLVLRDRHAY